MSCWGSGWLGVGQLDHFGKSHSDILDVYLYLLKMDYVILKGFLSPQNCAFVAGRLPFKTWR